MEFPAVTFLSNVQFSGGFLKRLDAIMMGVWFFPLFALLNMHLHYACLLLQEGIGKKRNWNFPVILAAVYLLGAAFDYTEQTAQLFFRFFLFVSAPMYVLLPVIFLIAGRKTS
jgi:hypothetical protein